MFRQPLNVAGMRSTKLVAVRVVGKNKNGGILWECKCDCGGTRNVAAADIVKGKVRSCGCVKRRTQQEIAGTPRQPPLRKKASASPRPEKRPAPRIETTVAPRVRPWLLLSDAERATLRVRINECYNRTDRSPLNEDSRITETYTAAQQA